MTEASNIYETDQFVFANNAEPTASISGRYFCDENANGLEDETEPGIANVLVQLLDNGGHVVAETTTTADGTYIFDNLQPGVYQVMFVVGPEINGKHFVTANVGSDDTVDSDVVDFEAAKTDFISVAAGENITDVDAGIAYDQPQSFDVEKAISNFVVYLDADGENGDEITKIKFEIANGSDEFHFLSLGQVEDALSSVGYDDVDILALTIKAGNNKGGFGPGEGEFFDANLDDDFETGTAEKADVTVLREPNFFLFDDPL